METQIFPCYTDCPHFRLFGIPALSFTPINNTPVSLDEDGHHLTLDAFLEGIEIYYNIILSLGNVV